MQSDVARRSIVDSRQARATRRLARYAEPFAVVRAQGDLVARGFLETGDELKSLRARRSMNRRQRRRRARFVRPLGRHFVAEYFAVGS